MLRTRLVVGTVLVALAVALFLADWGPHYPLLLLLLVGVALAACFELLRLLGPLRPAWWLCCLGVVALLAANWAPGFLGEAEGQPWRLVALVLAAVVFAGFLVEMARFREPGQSVVRLAVTVWLVAYLGLLPCFLAQLRWLGGGGPAGTSALLLAIFVPKCCDIGAYFTGRFLGRHPLAPVLSPKKTWEGAAGGLALAAAVAVALDRLGPARVLGPWWAEVGFGLTVGLAGMFGDLAESLVKRDVRQKDASQAVPGFGGVLDVVDAILLAAPVAYVWLVVIRPGEQAPSG
jgi:phosphatidate cytidylyltransferase